MPCSGSGRKSATRNGFSSPDPVACKQVAQRSTGGGVIERLRGWVASGVTGASIASARILIVVGGEQVPSKRPPPVAEDTSSTAMAQESPRFTGGLLLRLLRTCVGTAMAASNRNSVRTPEGALSSVAAKPLPSAGRSSLPSRARASAARSATTSSSQVRSWRLHSILAAAPSAPASRRRASGSVSDVRATMQRLQEPAVSLPRLRTKAQLEPN